MSESVMRSLVLVVLALLLASVPAYAQFGLGGIMGTVQDKSKAVIPGASVVAKEVNTGVETTVTTTVTGTYRFLSLPLGTYSVAASSPGFQTVNTHNNRVILGQTVTVDFELPVGEVTEIVTVTARLSTEDRTSSTTGVTRVAEELEMLPINSSGGARSVVTFMRTMAGITTRDPNQEFTGTVIYGVGDSGGFRSSGGYTVDGVDSNVGSNYTFNFRRFINLGQQSAVPIPDLVSEFRVVTNQDAENGFNQGASIQIITKSGTNDYHGTAFWYLRNTALDARNFLAAEVAPNKLNEYGFVFGGPIVKDKHFFIASWDGVRRTLGAGGIVRTVPTAKMRAGDFSEWLGPAGRQIYDPLTTRSDGAGGFIREPFPGNILPTERLSPISTFLQAPLPLPTGAGVEDNTVVTLRPGQTPFNVWNVKTDHLLGKNHRLSGFFERIWQSSDVTDVARRVGWLPLELETDGAKSEAGWRVRFHHTWTIRPNLLYSFRAGILYGKTDQDVPEEAKTFGQEAGLTGVFDARTPRMNIARIGQSFGNFQTLILAAQNQPVRMDLAWIKGTHAFKFGLEYKNGANVRLLTRNANGQFTFADATTAFPLDANSGVGYASFLLGDVSSGDLVVPFAQKWTHASWGIYAQDRWQATSRLTINYGLRWDIHQYPYESYDRMASFDPTIPNQAAGGILGALTFYGEGAGRNGRRRVVDASVKNFGPRLGLAYRVDSVTVARAHYGIHFYPINNIANQGQFIPNYGWGATVNLRTQDNNLTPTFNWDDGFPSGIPPLPVLDPTLQNGSNAIRFDPRDNKAPLSQAFGFSLERMLPWDVTVKGEYAANLSRSLWADGLGGLNQLPLRHLSLGNLLLANIDSPEARAANISIPYPGFTGTVQQALRPFPQYQNIVLYNSMTAKNLYHALNMHVQKRFSGGMHFLVAYSIQKTLTNDGFGSTGGGTGAGQIPHTDLRESIKFRANHDRSQTLNVSWVYELPFGPGKRFLNTANPVLQHLVGDWTFSAIQNYGSGSPVVISGARGIPTAGPAFVVRNNSVPVRTGVGCGDYDPRDPQRNTYLNIGAFFEPAPFTLGNTRVLPNVNTCRFVNEDVSIAKKFHIKELVNVELGADFFNIFNRHFWNNRGFRQSISSPGTFGRYTQASRSRSIQMHLRINF